MSEGYAANADYQPGQYEIRVAGHLDERLAAWFEGMSVKQQDNGETLLTGVVIDQAALHGLLKKVRDLGMTLIAVNRVEPNPADAGPARE